MEKKPRTVEQRLQTRLDSLERLGSHTSGLTVDQASNAFREVWHRAGEPPAVYVRRRFLRRETFLEVAGDRDRTPRAKPPLATLIRPRGVALQLELTLLFLAQCQAKNHFTPKVRHQVIAPAGALGLIDFLATGTNRRPGAKYRRMPSSMRADQVRAALERLSDPKLQLVDLALNDKRKPDHDQGVTLLKEVGPTATGGPSVYERPRRGVQRTAAVVAVPAAFFTNGWIQVLTDSEIANWLMWRDLGEMRQHDIVDVDELSIDAENRLGWYDLTRDAWDTHQTLSRMGLMTVTFAEDRREDGTVVEFKQGNRGAPHRFGVVDDGLAEPALPTAIAAIAGM